MNFYVALSFINLFLIILLMAVSLRCHFKMRAVVGFWLLLFLASLFGFFYILLGILPYYFASSPVDFLGFRAPVLFVVVVITFCAQYMYSREIAPLKKFIKGGK